MGPDVEDVKTIRKRGSVLINNDTMKYGTCQVMMDLVTHCVWSQSIFYICMYLRVRVYIYI